MERPYSLYLEDQVLKFRTQFFKAERGSILHTGIYNRELASSLGAGVLIVIVYFLFRPEPSVLIFLLAVLMFGVFFFVLRVFVFREQYLEAVIDKKEGILSVRVKGLRTIRTVYQLNEIQQVDIGHVVITPENPDGIKVVEKIALQHGTVIPGFGQKKEYFTVEFNLKGGKGVMIFATRLRAEAEGLKSEIEGFLGVQGA